jgi:hypothetical protein
MKATMSTPARWTVGGFSAVVFTTLNVYTLGPQYVDVSAKGGHPLGVWMLVAIVASIPTIILGHLLFRAGLAFVFLVLSALALLWAAPIFTGALNAGFDNAPAQPTPLTVVGKQLRGRHGIVDDPRQARRFLLLTAGWPSPPAERAVPVTVPAFQATTVGSTIVLCVHEGALGRQWIERPSVHRNATC